jgi:hypothetical protein
MLKEHNQILDFPLVVGNPSLPSARNDLPLRRDLFFHTSHHSSPPKGRTVDSNTNPNALQRIGEEQNKHLKRIITDRESGWGL